MDEIFRFDLKEEHFENFKEMYQQIIESNTGGFTSRNKYEFEYDCKDDWNIKCFDRNSMYPTIMIGDLPYGDLLPVPPVDDRYVT